METPIRTSMDHASTVDIFQRTEHLVHEVGNMLIAQSVSTINNSMKIRRHQLADNVDVLKLF